MQRSSRRAPTSTRCSTPSWSARASRAKNATTSATSSWFPRCAEGTGCGGNYQQPLLIVMAIVALVLLIGCANVANLLIARASARRSEMAVRLAIGAGRGRLIRQLLTEGAVLVSLGTSSGCCLRDGACRSSSVFLATPGGAILLEPVFDSRVIALHRRAGCPHRRALQPGAGNPRHPRRRGQAGIERHRRADSAPRLGTGRLLLDRSGDAVCCAC